MIDIEKLFIHCSATKNYQSYPAASIDAYHKSKGWKKIGYHRVFQPDGTIEVGRSFNEIGAGVFGQNQKSIHFCIIGTDEFSTEALKQLFLATLTTCRTFGLKAGQVIGHYEADAKKSCPNIDMEIFRGAIAALLDVRSNQIGS